MQHPLASIVLQEIEQSLRVLLYVKIVLASHLVARRRQLVIYALRITISLMMAIQTCAVWILHAVNAQKELCAS
jgi:hypothetical protein